MILSIGLISAKEDNRLRVALAFAIALKGRFFRDAVIQRFEYTFELAWKTLKRYLDSVQPILEFNMKDLYREWHLFFS
jgi:Nucleotidyltransferase substrate binding protein like